MELKRTPKSYHNKFTDATRISDLSIKIIDATNSNQVIIEHQKIQEYELRTRDFMLEGFVQFVNDIDFETSFNNSNNIKIVIFFKDLYDRYFQREFQVTKILKSENGNVKFITLNFIDAIFYIMSKTFKAKTIKSKNFEDLVTQVFDEFIFPNLISSKPILTFDLPSFENIENSLFSTLTNGIKQYSQIASNTLNKAKSELSKGNITGAINSVKSGFNNISKVFGSDNSDSKSENQNADNYFNVTPNKSILQILSEQAEFNGYLMYQTKRHIVFLKLDKAKPANLKKYTLSYSNIGDFNSPNDVLEYKRVGIDGLQKNVKNKGLYLDPTSKVFKVLEVDAKSEGLTNTNDIQYSNGIEYSEQYQSNANNIFANTYKNLLSNSGILAVVVGHICDMELFRCANLNLAASDTASTAQFGSIKESGFYFVTSFTDKIYNGLYFLQLVGFSRFDDTKIKS